MDSVKFDKICEKIMKILEEEELRLCYLCRCINHSFTVIRKEILALKKKLVKNG